MSKRENEESKGKGTRGRQISEGTKGNISHNIYIGRKGRTYLVEILLRKRKEKRERKVGYTDKKHLEPNQKKLINAKGKRSLSACKPLWPQVS